MAWQQFVFAGGAIWLAIALWPSIRSQNKPDIKTSVLTAIWLTLYLVVYITLQFWFAMVFEIFCVVGWWILVWQMRKDWRTLPLMPKGDL